MIYRYTFSEISKVPTHPGLYAWYAAIEIGEADIIDERQFLGVLHKQSSILLSQRMEILAKLDFSLQWSGLLNENSGKREGKHDFSAPISKAGLEVLSRALTSAAPTFFRPLYIGKTKRGLKKRIKEHVDAFYALKQLQGSVEIEAEDQFAARAVRAGFTEDQLVCYVFPFADAEELNDGEMDRVLLVAESFLNEWATPVLGRV